MIPRTHACIIPKQVSIDVALSKPVIHAGLRVANNARLTTAIANLCNAENVQDRVVGTFRFKEVIDAAKMVGAEYKNPHRNDIGGCLLKENDAVYRLVYP